MAEPPADQLYLPPLESCLKGETIILSWRLVASALMDPSGHRQSSKIIIDFFNDPSVQALFTSPGSAFEPSKTAHLALFEKKTAAIYVTPTTNDKYDVKEIKEDTLWLSKNAGINELAALRIVVIEHQSRPASQLLGPISNQDVASLRAAAGAGNLQSAHIIPGLSLTASFDAAAIRDDFDKAESRRHRIFSTYLNERCYYAATNDYIFTLMLQEKLPMSPTTEASDSIRKSVLEAYGISFKQTQNATAEIPTKTCHALISQYIGLLPDCVQRAKSNIEPVVQDKGLLSDEIQELWTQTSFTEMVHRMTILYQLLDRLGDRFVSEDVAKTWFSLVNDLSFLNQLQGFSRGIADLMIPLQSLVCVISLKMLNLPRMMAFFEGDIDLDTDNEYLATSSVLEQIHDALEGSIEMGSDFMAPVLFAWVLIVHAMFASYQERAEKRDAIQNQKAVENYESNSQMAPSHGRRNSAGSITTIDKRRYDDFLINKGLDRDFQKIQFLAMFVTDEIHVFDVIASLSSHLGPTDRGIFPSPVGSRMRMAFLELLKATYPIVGYKSEPLTALLSVLSGAQGYWDIPATREASQHDILSYALNDQVVLDAYVQQALDRFPYEFAPFINLIRTLSCAPGLKDSTGHDRIVKLLEKTPTLTFTLPEDFTQYHLANEEENTNAFQFSDDFPLFSPVSSRRFITADEELFTIPAGTFGRFIVDEGKIVRVEYEHSALALLGKRLEVNLGVNRYDMALGALTMDGVAEVVSLLATLVRTARLRDADSLGTGLVVIAEASRALPSNKDVISVVCDTMDVILDGDHDYSELEPLVACVQFLHALLPICPGRVWSYMARCTLLQSQSHGGRLGRILGNLDLSGIQFDLLMSIVRLFSDLVESAMSSSVQRKTDIKGSSRSRSTENVWLGVSDKIITQVTSAVLQTVVGFLESSSTWRFATDLDRMVLVRDLVPIMDKVIYYVFSMDDISSKTALISVLEPAARFIVDSFLGPSAGSLRILPLLGTLVAATQGSDSTIYAHRSKVFRDQAIAVLKFATNLVSVTNYSGRSSSTLEHQLFKITPFVVRLCARDDAFKGPAIGLLESLVISVGKTVGEPLSLLGSLGPQTARSFLQFVSNLDRPFNQAQQSNIIWRFFSIIIRNRQQWVANCLLTGHGPQEAKETNTKLTETTSSSILSTALTRLASLPELDQSEALSILDFITSAQNYWPWTIFALQKNTSFLAELRSYIRNLQSPSKNEKDVVKACNEARTAAYIAEIFAMQLFHLRQLGQANTLAKELTQDLDYYLRDGVKVPGYNTNFHVNFSRNFNRQYPHCSVDNFKRTMLEPKPLGAEFYYAIGSADKMLSFEPSWKGPRNTGFRFEMEMANKNMSLVEAQVALYHAWESLLLELSTCLPNNDTLKKQSLQVARQCLEANQESEAQGQVQVLERLAESRVNLALMLAQRVVQNAPSAGDVTQLLNTLWQTLSNYQNPYTKQKVAIYRSLLRLLYVTLRALVSSGGQTDLNASVRDSQGNSISPISVSQSVLGILDVVVAKGFRTVVTLIHDSDTEVFTGDLVIINGILQACLCVPGMEQSQTQILNIMAAHDATQAAVSLYSWADKLADQGDPVYGELALLFLLELSALPSIAEQLACDGLLDHITSASLATHLRRPNVSPFADSVGLQRCYSIWAKGIVPILLNMLSALGPTIAREVAYVLNQFPNLMQSSTERFDTPSDDRGRDHRPTAIASLSVSEIHCMALMTQVLNVLRTNNVSEVPAVAWDSSSLLENVDWWIDHRKVLRDSLYAMGPREVELKMMPASDAEKKRGSENRLEAKIVEQLEVVRLVLSEGLE